MADDLVVQAVAAALGSAAILILLGMAVALVWPRPDEPEPQPVPRDRLAVEAAQVLVEQWRRQHGVIATVRAADLLEDALRTGEPYP